jgi:NADH-quinone oxidoreductase subunit F
VSTWLPKMYQKLLAGLGTRDDLLMMEEMARNLRGTAFCLLADSCAMPVAASFQHFRHEYEYLVDHGVSQCPTKARWSE